MSIATRLLEDFLCLIKAWTYTGASGSHFRFYTLLQNIETSGFQNLEFVVEKDALNKLSHMTATLAALF